MSKRINIILAAHRAIKQRKYNPEGFTHIGTIKYDGTIKRVYKNKSIKAHKSE